MNENVEKCEVFFPLFDHERALNGMQWCTPNKHTNTRINHNLWLNFICFAWSDFYDGLWLIIEFGSWTVLLKLAKTTAHHTIWSLDFCLFFLTKMSHKKINSIFSRNDIFIRYIICSEFMIKHTYKFILSL